MISCLRIWIFFHTWYSCTNAYLYLYCFIIYPPPLRFGLLIDIVLVSPHTQRANQWRLFIAFSVHFLDFVCFVWVTYQSLLCYFTKICEDIVIIIHLCSTLLKLPTTKLSKPYKLHGWVSVRNWGLVYRYWSSSKLGNTRIRSYVMISNASLLCTTQETLTIQSFNRTWWENQHLFTSIECTYICHSSYVTISSQ